MAEPRRPAVSLGGFGGELPTLGLLGSHLLFQQQQAAAAAGRWPPPQPLPSQAAPQLRGPSPPLQLGGYAGPPPAAFRAPPQQQQQQQQQQQPGAQQQWPPQRDPRLYAQPNVQLPQPGIIGELPPELRSAGDGGALLRLLQGGAQAQAQAPLPLQHYPRAPPGAFPPPRADGGADAGLTAAFSGLRFAGAPIGPPQPGAAGAHGLNPSRMPYPQPPPHFAQAAFGGPQPPRPPQPLASQPHPPQPAPPPLPPQPPAPPRVNQREVREANAASRASAREASGGSARPPGRSAPPRQRADAAALSAQLAALASSLQPSEAHVSAQKAVFARVEALVRCEWPDSQLLMYGSCANGFGGPDSDVDTCLALQWASGSGEEALARKRRVVQRIAELATPAAGFSRAQAITHARMPVVKLACGSSGVACDVCVNNFLAVLNTRLLRDYAQLDPRLRQLVYAVKHWARRRCVNEPYTGTLSSYCYVLMCIHLLQTRSPPILPCLQAMNHTFRRDVEGLAVGYCDDLRPLAGAGARNGESLADLLLAFFTYWARQHDYGQSVVCVRTGGTVSKRRKGWTTRVGTERHLICVEDPFEVSHDLGRVVDKRSIVVLREEFERAERILRSEESPLEHLFEAYEEKEKEGEQ